MEKDELKYLQAFDFPHKVMRSQTKILEYILKLKGKVYVAFSGGVDSTVLLDMTCRVWASLDEYRDKPLTVIFADTGNEFMAIRRFVVEFCEICEKCHGIKIDLIKARNKDINFYNIPATVGYPVVSKKVSRMIRDIRTWCREIMAAHQIEGELTREVFERIIVEYEPEMTHTIRLYFTGITSKGKKCKSRKLPLKWYKLCYAPFEVSEKNCDLIKKDPCKAEAKKRKLYGLVATMAGGSKQRESAYLATGCNSFNGSRTKSQPMGFWFTDDVTEYLRTYSLEYCKDVYGDICPPGSNKRFTKEQHTGCKLCLFGCHLEDEPNRIQRLASTEPKMYDFAIRKEQGGLNYGEVMDYLGIPYKVEGGVNE